MDAVTLLERARAAGLSLEVDGDRLRVRGPKSAEPVVQLLAAHKAEIMRLLTRREMQDGPDAVVGVALPCPGLQPVAEPAGSVDPEVAWRIDAMRPEVPPRGPIPFLVARRDVAPQPDCCLSCGDPLPEARRCRCGPCQRAAEIVLNEVRR